MDKQFKNTNNIAKLLNDISIRKQIIQNYQLTGWLDREDAIRKIMELRYSDRHVAEVTFARLSTGSYPFSQATDQDIISELQTQIIILLNEMNDNK